MRVKSISIGVYNRKTINLGEYQDYAKGISIGVCNLEFVTFPLALYLLCTLLKVSPLEFITKVGIAPNRDTQVKKITPLEFIMCSELCERNL